MSERKNTSGRIRLLRRVLSCARCGALIEDRPGLRFCPRCGSIALYYTSIFTLER